MIQGDACFDDDIFEDEIHFVDLSKGGGNDAHFSKSPSPEAARPSSTIEIFHCDGIEEVIIPPTLDAADEDTSGGYESPDTLEERVKRYNATRPHEPEISSHFRFIFHLDPAVIHMLPTKIRYYPQDDDQFSDVSNISDHFDSDEESSYCSETDDEETIPLVKEPKQNRPFRRLRKLFSFVIKKMNPMKRKLIRDPFEQCDVAVSLRH